MESLLITTEEIGNHRIKIYYDNCASCPCTDWDLAALYLFEYNDRYLSRLHKECNWKEVWGESGSNNHSLDDSLRILIEENCDFDLLWDYIKSEKMEEVRLNYDRSAQEWKLSVYGHWIFDGKPRWNVISEISPYDRKGKCWSVFEELFDVLETKDLVEILNACGKNIYAKEWGTIGYCQGERVDGVAFCTKERFDKYVGNVEKPWKEHIDMLIDQEVKQIGMWLWGDVKGFELEKKVEFTKTFKDGREPEEDHEWEEVHSCWGYFMETEELIEEVVSEYDLKEEMA